jgi:hypothetical protein
VAVKPDTALHRYITHDAAHYRMYEAYEPDAGLLDRVLRAMPHAHVLAAGCMTCPDCTRNIPRMARIAEYLPGWTWDVFDVDEDPARRAALGATLVPTFIIYDEDEQEVGRIIENPSGGSLEVDLLRIVTGL